MNCIISNKEKPKGNFLDSFKSYLKTLKRPTELLDKITNETFEYLQKLPDFDTSVLHNVLSEIPYIDIKDIKKKFGTYLYQVLEPINGTAVANKIFSDGNHYSNVFVAPPGPAVWKKIGTKTNITDDSVYWYDEKEIFDRFHITHVQNTVRGIRNRQDHPEIMHDFYKFKERIALGIYKKDANHLKIPIEPFSLRIALYYKKTSKIVHLFEYPISYVYLIQKFSSNFIQIVVDLENNPIDLPINFINGSFKIQASDSPQIQLNPKRSGFTYIEGLAASELNEYILYGLNLNELLNSSDILAYLIQYKKDVIDAENAIKELKYKYANRIMAKGYF